MKVRNLILDIDETLVSSHPINDFPFDNAIMRKRILDYTFHNMDSYYIIFERPMLQEFLDYAFKNFNVSIWSAASKDYVLFIVKNIILQKEDRKLDYVFWNYHCKKSKKKYKNKKDLRMLWKYYKLSGYNKKNSLLIDDLTETCETQRDNTINIKKFDILEQTRNDKILSGIKRKLSKLK